MVAVRPVDGTVDLADGRRVGYRLRGSLRGRVVAYLHGSPGSRAEGGWYTDRELAAADVSMLALERPGYGLSDPVSDVDLDARARDLLETCQLLEVHRFVVCGMSGGGTYALAMSALAPDRVAAAVLVSGQPRLDTPWALEGMEPDLVAEWTTEDVEANRRDNEEEVAALSVPAEQAMIAWEAMFDGFPSDEIAFVRKRREVFVEDGHELSRQGGHGYWIDGETRSLPWPFTGTDLPMPLHVFHGQADAWNPCQALLKDLEGAPRLTTTLYDGGMHLSPVITSERRLRILETARSAFD